jgi:hypothetical protein
LTGAVERRGACRQCEPDALDMWSAKANQSWVSLTLTNSNIPPRGYSFGGADLYAVLEAKCGGK